VVDVSLLPPQLPVLEKSPPPPPPPTGQAKAGERVSSWVCRWPSPVKLSHSPRGTEKVPPEPQPKGGREKAAFFLSSLLYLLLYFERVLDKTKYELSSVYSTVQVE